MSKILFLLTFSLPALLHAQSILWQDHMTGEFLSSMSSETNSENWEDKNAFQYLKCEPGQLISISGQSSNLSVLNSKIYDSPLEFSNIDKPPGAPIGHTVDSKQSRTTTTAHSETEIRIENQYRECTPFFGKLGCFAKDWQTTSFIHYVFGTNSSLTITLGFQRTPDHDLETCTFEPL